MLSDRECETAGTSKDMKVLIFLSYRLLSYLFLFFFFYWYRFLFKCGVAFISKVIFFYLRDVSNRATKQLSS